MTVTFSNRKEPTEMNVITKAKDVFNLVKQMDDLYKELFEEVNKDGSNSIESTNWGES